MNEAINVIYRVISAGIAIGFVVKAYTSHSRTEQVISSFIMLPFLLRTLGLK